jgi:hypothetical protein
LELDTGATLVWILQYSAALANTLMAVLVHEKVIGE